MVHFIQQILSIEIMQVQNTIFEIEEILFEDPFGKTIFSYLILNIF
jgi:hypothetical protein